MDSSSFNYRTFSNSEIMKDSKYEPSGKENISEMNLKELETN